MQRTMIKTGTQTVSTICKPGSPFALLKLSQATSSLMMPNQAARAFSYQPRQRRGSGSSDLRRDRSHSPGRASLKGVMPPHKYHTSLPRLVQEDKTATEGRSSVFTHDSTFTLCKKLMIYNMMGSNLFINYSLMGINVAYKVLGIRLTNLAIETTAASVFTGGVTVADLNVSTQENAKRGFGTIGCYVVEGVRDAENSSLDQFLDFSVESVNAITESGKEGHFALKLTAYISTDVMEKLSVAQDRFVKEVLQVSFDSTDNSVLSAGQLEANLASIDVTDYSR